MQRRHRRHLTEWQSLIAEFAASDFSVDQFCQHHDLSPQNFRRWHARLAGGDDIASPRTNNTARFVPVVPAQSANATAMTAVPPASAPAIRLHLASAQLELPADTPATRVAELIKAISHA